MGLCFLLFKILEASLGAPFPTVAEPRILAAHEAVMGWLAERGGADPPHLLDGLEDEAHESLVGHVLSVFYGGGAPPADYDEEVRAGFVVLLKTLTEAVDLGEVRG